MVVRATAPGGECGLRVDLLGGLAACLVEKSGADKRRRENDGTREEKRSSRRERSNYRETYFKGLALRPRPDAHRGEERARLNFRDKYASEVERSGYWRGKARRDATRGGV